MKFDILLSRSREKYRKPFENRSNLTKSFSSQKTVSYTNSMVVVAILEVVVVVKIGIVTAVAVRDCDCSGGN